MAHPFLQLADFIATEKHRRKSEKLRAGELDIARKRLEDIKRVHAAQYGEEVPVTPGPKDVGFTATRFKPGLEQQKVGLMEQELELAKQKTSAEQQSYISMWNKAMSSKPNPANLLRLAESEPAFKPAINLIIGKIGSGEVKTRFDAYQILKQNETSLIKQTRDTVIKDIEKAIKEGKYDEADAKANILNQLVPGFLENFFGFPENMRPKRPQVDLTMPGAKIKAAQANQPTTYGDVQVDENGLKFQLDSRGQRHYLPGQLTEAQKVKLVEDAENIINNPQNEPEALQGSISQFNQFAKKPYIYLYQEKPGKLYGTNKSVEKVPLPKIGGKQAYAEDVWFTADKRGITYEEVLQELGILPLAD